MLGIIAKLHRNQVDDEEPIAIRNKADKHQSKKCLVDGFLRRVRNGEILIVIPKLMQDRVNP